jgi:DNA helicase-2/ATP-dependent DNA helicase PcrA
MQDYTAIQYAVVSRLFKCRKTILGDASQQVNPYSASSAEAIERVFPQGDVIKLFRSYRSTMEITAFAQRIFRNPDLIPMERHGEVPEVRRVGSNIEEVEAIKQLIADFKESDRQSLGIICKTRDQAAYLHNTLQFPEVHLLTAESTSFREGIVLTTAHLSKGLEFDEVIVPFASERNYNTEVDKSMLYIACTRAMHRLTLLYSSEQSVFLNS